MHPVTYEADPPALAETPEDLALHITGEAPIDVRAALHRAVFTKGLRWEHEHEWRWWTIEDRPKRNAASASRMRTSPPSTSAAACRDEDRDAIMRIVRDVLPHVQLLSSPPEQGGVRAGVRSAHRVGRVKVARRKRADKNRDGNRDGRG